jgi:hypothetical protein
MTSASLELNSNEFVRYGVEYYTAMKNTTFRAGEVGTLINQGRTSPDTASAGHSFVGNLLWQGAA